jgi:fructose-specific component phosphotransferase system IIB-like protein
MHNLQIRPHGKNPNLWWVSSHGDDVAYITRPSNAYLAWTTGKAMPAHADFVGKRFDTLDEALEAVARSFA